MLFTSYEFIFFIAVLFLVYYIVPKKFQWMLLLGFSIVFYMLADWRFLIYMTITIASTYFASIRMEAQRKRLESFLLEHKALLSREEKKGYKAKAKKKQWRYLLICLILNFGILSFIKYTNFAIYNVNALLHVFGVRRQLVFLDLLLPLGISFYTFQTMGYLIDVYRGKCPAEKNPCKLALFVSFFPQLIQGPISRFDDLSKTLFARHVPDGKNIAYGLQRILWGYFKKLVIADRMLIAVTAMIQDTETYQGIFVFAGMLFYALELYADFTGGIDITIGIAQVLGITVKENFIRPFFSKSIKEYWNRWHISLGSWFTEYVFYPVSVCQPMLKLSKFARKHFGEYIGKRAPVYIATIVVWLITGIWHGASWNFVIWGLGNCFFIMLSQELTPFYTWFHQRYAVGRQLWFKVFRVARTILLMSCLRMFDCYGNVLLTFRMFGTMFIKWNVDSLWNGEFLNLGLNGIDYLILGAGLCILFVVSMLQRSGSVRDRISQKPFAAKVLVWYGLFLVVLLMGVYGIGYDASQFIYNQF